MQTLIPSYATPETLLPPVPGSYIVEDITRADTTAAVLAAATASGTPDHLNRMQDAVQLVRKRRALLQQHREACDSQRAGLAAMSR